MSSLPILGIFPTNSNRRNPLVGYCQGLNLVVCRLLDFLNEEEAFWVLTRIIEVIIPIDFYTNMLGVLVDQHILKDVLSVKNPKLYKHFMKVGLDPTIPSMQWLVTLFANTMHFEVTQYYDRSSTFRGTCSSYAGV